jgi:hypothetical protein
MRRPAECETLEARALAEWFGLPLGGGRIVAALRSEPWPAFLTLHELADRASLTHGSTEVYLTYLRRGLPQGSFQHFPRTGYRLTPECRVECDGALQDLKARVDAIASDNGANLKMVSKALTASSAPSPTALQ